MCIEYIFILGYDDKEKNLPSVMVSALSSQSSGCGFIPMSDDSFFFFFGGGGLFLLFTHVIHSLF